MRSRWTQPGQRAEPAAVHISTVPQKQEYGDEGCHEETPLCRLPGPGGEWQTRAIRAGFIQEAVHQIREHSRVFEDYFREHFENIYMIKFLR